MPRELQYIIFVLIIMLTLEMIFKGVAPYAMCGWLLADVAALKFPGE